MMEPPKSKYPPTVTTAAGKATGAATRTPPTADKATREQQMEVANRVLGSQGWGAWPTTSKKAGVTGKKPAPAGTFLNAAVVPPPTVQRPPGTLDESDQPLHNTTRLIPASHPKGWSLPHWLVLLLWWVGLPLLVLLLVMGLIGLLKSRRRHRRRTRGSASQRYAAGWQEILDQARDLRLPVTTSATRAEQARELTVQADGAGLRALANAADHGVFGPGDPPEQAATDYWREVRASCRRLRKGAGLRRRAIARFNLATFRRTRRQRRAALPIVRTARPA